MSALRIHKRIDGPIPGLPELTPLIGKTVDIIVMEVPTIETSSESIRSQRVRLAGIVKSVDEHLSALILLLDSGDLLNISWIGSALLSPSELLEQRVAVDGTARFSDHGVPTRIEADAVAPARPEDSFFSRPPRAAGQMLKSSDLHKAQDSTSGMAQVFGAWPGDESDEEVLQALEDVE